MAETLSEELARLVSEYHEAPIDASESAEAWNLIADFTLEHADLIVSLLAAPAPTGKPTP